MILFLPTQICSLDRLILILPIARSETAEVSHWRNYPASGSPNQSSRVRFRVGQRGVDVVLSDSLDSNGTTFQQDMRDGIGFGRIQGEDPELLPNAPSIYKESMEMLCSSQHETKDPKLINSYSV